MPVSESTVSPPPNKLTDFGQRSFETKHPFTPLMPENEINAIGRPMTSPTPTAPGMRWSGTGPQ